MDPPRAENRLRKVEVHIYYFNSLIIIIINKLVIFYFNLLLIIIINKFIFFFNFYFFLVSELYPNEKSVEDLLSRQSNIAA